MKTIKFTPDLTELIKAGKKTTTFRLFDDKDLSVGDEVIFATRDGEKVTEFGKAQLLKVYTKLLKDLDADDYAGHEPVGDSPLDNYRKYYGDKVTQDTEVRVIKFKVLELL